ncbi:hypothetical protein [Salarchaeum japonicum]|uniref:hypothetical protein n=1 Tax=Salarchaeum japonicum TaxID=555573 RepID=UPI003C706CD5
MKRRNLLTGLGALTASASLGLGTGAFSSVSAKRSLSVSVADDYDALLQLTERGKGGRSRGDGGVVELKLPSNDRRVKDPSIGLGVDSVYEFDDDADATTDDGLFGIANHGTQPVDVYSESPESSDIDVELYDVTDRSKIALRDDPPTLGVGDQINVGIRVLTFGASTKTYDTDITIVAEASSD